MFEGEGESNLGAEGREKGQGEGLSRQQNQEVASVHSGRAFHSNTEEKQKSLAFSFQWMIKKVNSLKRHWNALNEERRVEGKSTDQSQLSSSSALSTNKLHGPIT